MNTEANILWQPTDSFKQNTHLRKYIDWLFEEKSMEFVDYRALYEWSVESVESFWLSLWEYFEIVHEGEISEVLIGEEMPDFRWFEGVKLSYAEHIFRKASDQRPALIFWDEEESRQISWTELERETARVRRQLKEAGVGLGDRVVAYLPNSPETICSFLAVNSLGAIWSCCSPDFGSETVIDRFRQIEPKVFLAVDGYQYNGKFYDRRAECTRIREALESLELAVIIDSKGKRMEGYELWSDWLAEGGDPGPLQFERVDFSHPIWVLYSSGTTGKPKAITHSHGGVLLEHLKYMHFHNDVHEGENFFWFTTTGWMMWNFLQASLLVGATAVLFDGSPSRPSLDRLWQMASELPIHHFGTSAPFLVACMKRGLLPGNVFDLSALRSIGSTGAPLPPEAFDWVYEAVGSHIWLCSMSGGTDVCTAFVGGQPWADVRRGRIQSRALGVAMEALDEEGQPIRDSLGEMVVRKPMPSMPIYFWNDSNKERYRSSYFEKYPGVWRHGDWIQIYEDDSLIIHGRSDATLNRNGIRIGTAEIYSVLNKVKGLKDALIINIEKESGGDFMPLFVVLDEEQEWTADLESLIKSDLRRHCSPRHVPDMIKVVDDIPYTLSGKKMEVPVKRLFMPQVSSAVNMDAVRNPEAMRYFVRLAEEKQDWK